MTVLFIRACKMFLAKLNIKMASYPKVCLKGIRNMEKGSKFKDQGKSIIIEYNIFIIILFI